MRQRDGILFGIFMCRNCVGGLFGLCYRGSYCQQERDVLFAQGRRAAEAFGHVLGEFTKTWGSPVWTAQCLQCAETIRVALDPHPGESDISGEAIIATRCRGAEPDGDASG